MKEPIKLNNNAKVPRRRRPTISWADIDATRLHAYIVAVTEAGCAPVFGRTTNGGALSLVVLAGEQKPKEYANDAPDCYAVMAEILEVLDIEVPADLLE